MFDYEYDNETRPKRIAGRAALSPSIPPTVPEMATSDPRGRAENIQPPIEDIGTAPRHKGLVELVEVAERARDQNGQEARGPLQSSAGWLRLDCLYQQQGQHRVHGDVR